MAGVAVVSDSTAYLPRRLAEVNGITVLSQYVLRGERVDREDEIDLESFFEDMRGTEQLPTTSHPTTDDFERAYTPLLDAGNDIVSVHSSGTLSRTCEAAREAAERLEAGPRVQVVDSHTAAAGLALIVVAAARRAGSGESADRVVEAAVAASGEMKLWFALDTLEYLKRGGRIGAAGALIGATLRVKPILTIADGQISPVERVRTSERAFERIVDYARQRHTSGADAWVVQHTRSPEAAERLVQECREVFGTEPLFVSEIGPVVGAHTGPGLIGLAAMPPRLLA